MSMNIEPSDPGVARRTRDPLTVLAGGSFAQAAAAGGAAVLAIIGLAGTLTDEMMHIATIALGAAFLLQAGGVASQYLGYFSRARRDEFGPAIAAGLTASSVAGVTAIALGILALLDVEPLVLVPTAIIALSGGLILDSATSTDTTAFSYQSKMDESLIGGSRFGLNGGDVLVGVAGVTIGILALIGISTVTLSLVGLLALGVSSFLKGSAIGVRLMSSR
jgi:hypothetical protein